MSYIIHHNSKGLGKDAKSKKSPTEILGYWTTKKMFAWPLTINHDHAFAHDLLRLANPRRSGQSGSSRSSSKLSMSTLSRDVSVGARRKKWGWSLTLTMKFGGYKQCGPHLISPPKLRNMLNQGCWRILDVRRRSLQDKPTSDGDMNKWTNKQNGAVIVNTCPILMHDLVVGPTWSTQMIYSQAKRCRVYLALGVPSGNR